MTFINYAHRGASAYAPENTLAAFYLGRLMGANGIETDVQCTKDGVPVLFHDRHMRRIAGVDHAIHDLTYEELLQYDMGAYMGDKFSGERIATLEEFLRHFSGKPLHFAIEIKELGVEAQTLKLIDQYGCRDRVIITSGMWEALETTRRLDPAMRLGHLASELNDGELARARQTGVTQICPKASALTEAWNKRMRDEGFSVRAWGIDGIDTMNRMLDLQVDGMTVNFSDLLQKALTERGLLTRRSCHAII